jgi:RND family efflux transporter MFP subunit
MVEDVVVSITSFGLRAASMSLASALLGCGSDARSANPPHTASRSQVQQAGASIAALPTRAEFIVDTSTVALAIDLPAQLYVEHDAVVVARSAGTIDSLFAELGDRVRVGQPLARMESTEQEIALASADAAFDNAGRAAVRARALTKSGFVTPADSEQSELQLRQTQIARRKAQNDVERTRVTAPFAGVVTVRQARPKRFVAVGDTLFRLTYSGPLLARVRVPEASARALKVGDVTSATASNGYSYAGRVIHAAPMIDAGSGTREMVMEINSAGALMAGSAVTMHLGREQRRITSVPREAVAADGYVVVVENGRSSLRPVTLGRDIGGGRLEVLSGVAPGERLARPGR